MNIAKKKRCWLLFLLGLSVSAVPSEVSAQLSANEDSVPQSAVFPIQHKASVIDNIGADLIFCNGQNVYNLKNFKIAEGKNIGSLRISPFRDSFAYLDNDGKKSTVVMRDFWKPKKKLIELSDNKKVYTAIAYNPANNVLYTADSEGVLSLLGKNGKETRIMDLPLIPTYMEITPDGRYLAAYQGSSLILVDLDMSTVKSELPTRIPINDMAFSTDGTLMAVLTSNSECNVYEVSGMKPLHTYGALGNAISVSFHPEDKYLGVVTGDKRVALINMLNNKDRQYVDSETPGVTYVDFIPDMENGIYLVYNTDADVVFHPLFSLTPNRQKLLADQLDERMEEWLMRLPGESVEEYNLRTSEANRMAQMQLFETEIATEMAGDLLAGADLTFGSYNPEMEMLTLGLGLDGMQDIYLTVPPDQLGFFQNPGDLAISNARYFLNDNDEFELAFAEFTNTKNGETYVYDNMARNTLDFLEDGTGFIPFDRVMASMEESLMLEEIRNDIVTNAMANEDISDHTNITVDTKVVDGPMIDGRKTTDYIVDVAYTVEEEFSSKDDFGPGKYKVEESNAALSMLKILSKAFEGDLAKYLVPGKSVEITTIGMADASKIRGMIKYDGAYGDFVDAPVQLNGEEILLTVTPDSGITTNEQLAFLRSAGLSKYLKTNMPKLKQMNVKENSSIEVSDKAGSQYRRIAVQLRFPDAF